MSDVIICKDCGSNEGTLLLEFDGGIIIQQF